MRRITLLIADAESLCRAAIADQLERVAGLSVVAQVDTAAEALAQAVSLRPRVLVMGTDLPDDPHAVCRQVCDEAPETAVVMLAHEDHDVELFDAWACGARGFVAKTKPLPALLATIKAVGAGGPAFTPEQIDRIQTFRLEVDDRLRRLRPRLRQTAFWLARRYTNREIAAAMTVEEHTAEKYVSEVLRDLHMSRAERRAWAERTGALRRRGPA
jgi:DNA-binding NarL/FixJ family response regulator